MACLFISPTLLLVLQLWSGRNFNGIVKLCPVCVHQALDSAASISIQSTNIYSELSFRALQVQSIIRASFK